MVERPPQQQNIFEEKDEAAMEQTTPNTTKLLKVRDVQKMLSVGRDTVYDLIATGGIRSVQIGRSLRVPADAVDEYIASLPSGSKVDDSHAA